MKDSNAINHFTEKVIELGPHQTKQVALGSYSNADAEPHFMIDITPDHEMLGYSLEKIEIPGSNKYILYYQLQNFSNKSCQVKLTLA